MESPIKPYQQRPDRSSGFTLVEVLIATLIMVVSIVTVTAALRQFSMGREKLGQYEHLYTTTLSLRDKILGETLVDKRSDSGTLNGLDYRYTCHLEQSANNFIYSEEVEQSGNKGQFLMMLFKITLEVGGKSFEFYKTEYKTRYETSKEEF